MSINDFGNNSEHIINLMGKHTHTSMMPLQYDIYPKYIPNGTMPLNIYIHSYTHSIAQS